LDSKFSAIYTKQEEYENLIISKSKSLPDKLLKNFDDKEKTAFSKELALLLHQEISEFINAVGNFKLHKTQKDVTDVKEVKEEIADMLIFVLDMALTHNMSADELLNEVIRKQDKNFHRQQTGY
jgi:NTP pyrophosphatase (non-canonical NTP hydrolase)